MMQVEAQLKAQSKAVGAALKRAGYPVPHAVLLDAVASAMNQRDWQRLVAKLSKSSPDAAETPRAMTSAPLDVSESTLFLLRLAYCLGNPVATQGLDEDALRQAAKDVVGSHLNGVLRWGGWNVPATLDLATATLDAGDFKPSGSPFGTFVLRMGAASLEIQIGFISADQQWVVTSAGAKEAKESLAQLVPDNKLFSVQAEQPVQAKFWTDDRVFEVPFDASAYFKRASDSQIAELFDIGFSGDYASDAVADFMGSRNAKLRSAFDYLATRNQSHRDTIGFECSVDENSLLNWMHSHKPALLARLLCAKVHVQFRQDSQTQVWTWSHGSITSTSGYGSFDEAVQGASERLGLLDKALTQGYGQLDVD